MNIIKIRLLCLMIPLFELNEIALSKLIKCFKRIEDISGINPLEYCVINPLNRSSGVIYQIIDSTGLKVCNSKGFWGKPRKSLWPNISRNAAVVNVTSTLKGDNNCAENLPRLKIHANVAFFYLFFLTFCLLLWTSGISSGLQLNLK